MRLSAIFINDENELRSGWRILVFLILALVIYILLVILELALGAISPAFAAILRPPTVEEGASNHAIIFFAVNSGTMLLAILAATVPCAVFLEHRTFLSVGLRLHKGWFQDLSLGSLVGAGSIGLAVGLSAIARTVSFPERTENAGQVVYGLLVISIFFLIAAAFEEVFFRGFVFQALEHNLGPAAALIITATPFGLLHLANPNATLFSTLNTILAGVWLGIAYLRTRSLWLAIGLHWSWNAVMVFFFGLPVSGLTTFDQLGWLHGREQQPFWISGGSYGPEGGAAATVALAASMLLLWRGKWFTTTPEMAASIQHGKSEATMPSVVPAGE